MVDDPNKAQARQQPPQPNPHLKNLDRLVGTWERQKGCLHVPLSETATTTSCDGASYSEALGLLVFSASKVGGNRGSRTLLPGWHPPPTHIIRRSSPALLLLLESQQREPNTSAQQ